MSKRYVRGDAEETNICVRNNKIWHFFKKSIISNTEQEVPTIYGSHRSDFSFPSHGEKNNPVMVTLTEGELFTLV